MPLNTVSDVGNRVRFCLKRTGGPSTCPNIGDVFLLDEGTTVVGRNPTKSDIYLDSAIHKALISRLHARISVGFDNKVKICDTSLNGTYVNDEKILDTVEINPGDTVTFGHVKGAVLVPGTVAKQLKSEFRFKLEKYVGNTVHNVTIDSGKENTQENKKIDIQGFIPNLSSFMRGKTESKVPIDISLADDGTAEGTIGSMPSTVDSDVLVYNNEDDDELLAFAAAAEGAMDEESDTELFSVNIPSPLLADVNISNPSMSPQYASQKTPEKVDGSRQTKDTCANVNSVDSKGRSGESTQGKTSKKAKSFKKSRRKSCPWITKKRKHTKTNTGYGNSVPDVCGFGSDCLCPHDQHEVVNWVQCDYCEKWYHLECAGLTIDTVSGKLKKFNCGCS